MSFYTTLRDGVVSLVHTLKTTDVQVIRATAGLQAPNADFEVVDPENDTYILEAVVIGVEQQYVDGDLVQADDLQIIASPLATISETTSAFEPSITDEYSIDGKIHRANKIERIPASGTATCFLIFVKS